MSDTENTTIPTCQSPFVDPLFSEPEVKSKALGLFD